MIDDNRVIVSQLGADAIWRTADGSARYLPDRAVGEMADGTETGKCNLERYGRSALGKNRNETNAMLHSSTVQNK